MTQITPQMRVLAAVAPADFRSGIDGRPKVCRQAPAADPFSGVVFVFRNRRGAGLRLLVYDLCGAPRYVEWRSEAPCEGQMLRAELHITRTGRGIRSERLEPFQVGLVGSPRSQLIPRTQCRLPVRLAWPCHSGGVPLLGSSGTLIRRRCGTPDGAEVSWRQARRDSAS